MSTWISVNERLPDTPCLVYYENTIVKAFYARRFEYEQCEDVDDFCDCDENTGMLYLPEGWHEMIDNWDEYASVAINRKVTHWTPLPDPP